MKVLTAAQMREVDRRTIELGIPGIVLMENAGHRVLEVIGAALGPLSSHRIVVLCGKRNNGGDGLVVARQLLTRIHPRELHVVLAADVSDLRGDAAANFRMFHAAGGQYVLDISPAMTTFHWPKWSLSTCPPACRAIPARSRAKSRAPI